MKSCNKCNQSKNLEEFNKDPRNSDGRTGTCRACKMAAGVAYRDKLSKVVYRPAVEHKTCTQCKETKSSQLFYKDKACLDGHSSICKSCKTAKVMQWRAANKDRYNAAQRAFQRTYTAEERYGSEIKRRYGCTLEQYNEMLTAQGGACAICKELHNPAVKRGRLYVDHDHATGAVRSLLCRRCNCMIGYAGDDTRLLLEAVAYLTRYKQKDSF